MHLKWFSLHSAIYTLIALPHLLVQALAHDSVFKLEVLNRSGNILFCICSLSWSSCLLAGKLEWIVFPPQLTYSTLDYK